MLAHKIQFTLFFCCRHLSVSVFLCIRTSGQKYTMGTKLNMRNVTLRSDDHSSATQKNSQRNERVDRTKADGMFHFRPIRCPLRTKRCNLVAIYLWDRKLKMRQNIIAKCLENTNNPAIWLPSCIMQWCWRIDADSLGGYCQFGINHLFFEYIHGIFPITDSQIARVLRALSYTCSCINCTIILKLASSICVSGSILWVCVCVCGVDDRASGSSEAVCCDA